MIVIMFAFKITKVQQVESKEHAERVPFQKHVWATCLPVLASYVGSFFLMNVSYMSQDLWRLKTLVFVTQNTQERFNKMKCTAKSNSMVCRVLQQCGRSMFLSLWNSQKSGLLSDAAHLRPDWSSTIATKSFFQRDDTPAHITRAFRFFLDEMFRNSKLGRFGPTSWPGNSLDLVSLNVFLWGFLSN